MAAAKSYFITVHLRDGISSSARKAGESLSFLKRQGDGIKNAFNFAGAMNQAAEGMRRFGQMARAVIEAPAKTFIDFEDQMVRVGALSDASASELDTLTTAARDAGKSTRFSATQAAEGLEFLATAGLKANESVTALTPVLNVATANAMKDVGRVTEIVTDTMNGFGLEAKHTAIIGDVLSKAAADSTTNLAGIGEAMKYVAPIARTAGADLERTTAAIAALADVGTKGSAAGTALRAMFLRLAAPTGKLKKHAEDEGLDVKDIGRGRDALHFLGIDPNDHNGNIRPFEQILSDIDAAIKRKNLGSGEKLDIFKKIFGEEAAPAAIQLVQKAGEGALQAYIEKLENAKGTTEEMAAKMSATTKGLIEEISGTWEELNIELGSSLRGDIHEIGRAVKEMVVAFTGWAKEHPGAVAGFGKLAVVVVGATAVLAPLTLGISALGTAFGVARTMAVPLTFVLQAAAVKMGVLDAATLATAGSMGGLRAALNASALAASINGVTSTLGKVGLLGAALGVGYAFGTWLDNKFEISNWLVDVYAQLVGINDQLDQAGGRRKTQGMLPGEDQEYADGTVISGKTGDVLKVGTKGGPVPKLIQEARAKGLTSLDDINKFRKEREARLANEPARKAATLRDLAKNAPDAPGKITKLQGHATRAATKAELLAEADRLDAEASGKPPPLGPPADTLSDVQRRAVEKRRSARDAARGGAKPQAPGQEGPRPRVDGTVEVRIGVDQEGRVKKVSTTRKGNVSTKSGPLPVGDGGWG